MISSRKLIKLAKKWQRMAAIRPRRITLPRIDTNIANANSTSSMAEKGHFVVYSADHKRFVLPLEYLKKYTVKALCRLAKEEFGTASSGPLTLPCDADFMEYVISLIKNHLTEEVKEALLTSMPSGCCLSSSYLHQESRNQRSLICSF